MWTLENRAKYNRDHLRYPSDLTDHEWAYVEPLIPPAKPGGGKRRTDMRAVMDGVMYIGRSAPAGCPIGSSFSRYRDGPGARPRACRGAAAKQAPVFPARTCPRLTPPA